MNGLLEPGLLIHAVLGVFSGAAVVFTTLAIFRAPKADHGPAGRPPARSRAGEPGIQLVASAKAGG